MFHVLHEDRYKYNFVGQVKRICEAAGIKNFHRLFDRKHLTEENRKSVMRCIKKHLVNFEHEKLKRIVTSMRLCPRIDFSRLAPGKGLASLRREDLSSEELLGTSVQIMVMSNSYLTSTIQDKNARCYAVGCDKLETDVNMFLCLKNTRLTEYKRELQSYFRVDHVLKQAKYDDLHWFDYILDPYHQNLGLSRLMSGDKHEHRITSVCRLAAQSAHKFRGICKKNFLKKKEEEAKRQTNQQDVCGSEMDTEEGTPAPTSSFSSFVDSGHRE